MCRKSQPIHTQKSSRKKHSSVIPSDRKRSTSRTQRGNENEANRNRSSKTSSRQHDDMKSLHSTKCQSVSSMSTRPTSNRSLQIGQQQGSGRGGQVHQYPRRPSSSSQQQQQPSSQSPPQPASKRCTIDLVKNAPNPYNTYKLLMADKSQAFDARTLMQYKQASIRPSSKPSTNDASHRRLDKALESFKGSYRPVRKTRLDTTPHEDQDSRGNKLNALTSFSDALSSIEKSMISSTHSKKASSSRSDQQRRRNSHPKTGESEIDLSDRFDSDDSFEDDAPCPRSVLEEKYRNAPCPRSVLEQKYKNAPYPRSVLEQKYKPNHRCQSVNGSVIGIVKPSRYGNDGPCRRASSNDVSHRRASSKEVPHRRASCNDVPQRRASFNTGPSVEVRSISFRAEQKKIHSWYSNKTEQARLF